MAKTDEMMGPTALIERLNDCLPPLSVTMGPVQPIFIVGLPRSGSTLLVQLLIAKLRLGYATNLMARFWGRPAFGVALNRALSTDPGAISVSDSVYGQTQGYEGHHEFGWFWSRWFDYGDSHKIEPERWDAMDIASLRSELFAMEKAWGRPLIFKNPPALSMQIGFFEHFLDEPLFIYMRRSEPEVAASLLRARMNSAGGPHAWFSTRPPDVRRLIQLSLMEQVVGQVLSTRREIERQLSEVPAKRVSEVSYEKLVEAPVETLGELGGWLRGHRVELEWRTTLSGVERLINPPQWQDREQQEAFRRLFEDAS